MAETAGTLRRSLHVLRELPGHTERVGTVESIETSLESGLSPLVQRAFDTEDVEGLKEYMDVYRKVWIPVLGV